MSQRIELHPIVKELARDLELAHGRITLSDKKFQSWTARCKELVQAQRDAVATDIVGLAMRLAREAGEASKSATDRLCELAASLMCNAEAVRDLFAAAGASHVLKRAPMFGAAAPAGSVRASQFLTPGMQMRPRAMRRR